MNLQVYQEFLQYSSNTDLYFLIAKIEYQHHIFNFHSY